MKLNLEKEDLPEVPQELDEVRNEIAFPRRFTWLLKVLGALPQGVVDRMAASMARKADQNS